MCKSAMGIRAKRVACCTSIYLYLKRVPVFFPSQWSTWFFRNILLVIARWKAIEKLFHSFGGAFLPLQPFDMIFAKNLEKNAKNGAFLTLTIHCSSDTSMIIMRFAALGSKNISLSHDKLRSTLELELELCQRFEMNHVGFYPVA